MEHDASQGATSERSPASAPADAGELIAYRTRQGEAWGLEPATLNREWMDKTYNKVAYRCLPLAMANQAGWVITCPVTFKARWASRANSIESLTITFSNEQEEQQY